MASRNPKVSPSPPTKARDRVLVTSAATGLGRLISRRLHRECDVLAVDKNPFDDRPKDVMHLALDLRRKGALLQLKKLKPQAIVHLSGIHAPPDPTGHKSKLIDATVALLSLAEQAKVKKLVLLSSATLYGPSATTANFLTEEAPLLGASSVPTFADDISLDMMVQSFFWKHPEVETVILRPVHIVGPHLDNLVTRYLKQKTAPTLLGFDPMVQLVHEDDVVEAIVRALKPGVRGVFNIAGTTQAPLSRILQLRGALSLPLPGPLFRVALARARALRLSPIDEGKLDFLRYSLLVDDARARSEMGFVPTRNLQSTLVDLES